MQHVNRNLITLKSVLFLFFGGVGCIFPFLPLHMTRNGLSSNEAKIVSLVAPCIALLGPAVAGPLADKLAGGSRGMPRSKTGKYLRVMIAVCFILSAIVYWLLMVVPTTTRNHHLNTVGLVCGSRGGEIIVEKCKMGKPCVEWESEGMASFFVINCTYTCEREFHTKNNPTTINPEQETSASESEYNDHYDDTAIGSGEGPIEALFVPKTRLHSVHAPLQHVPHPHLCYTNKERQTHCHVYSLHSKPLELKVPLKKYLQNKTDSEVCTYPIGGDFYCRMGPKFDHNSTVDLTSKCNPIIKCIIHNPNNGSNSVLIESACGANKSSFWWYLVIRSIADIFPVTAVGLLGAAIIIATRETSTGRGDVGKQLAAGALGLAIFAPVGGVIDSYIIRFSIFSAFMVIGALILLIDSNMPLSPPEWWWHTRCGLLALPMSTVRKYNLEILALAFVLLLLGIFWNGIDPYIPWHILHMSGEESVLTQVNIGLTITVGALPAVLFLIFIEKIVDYCGHTNILIAAFTFYIIHYTALACIECPWLLLLCEALEIFTLHVTWVTAVLYLRHLVPRRFTASGQALPVMVHFCLGRLFGGLIGGLVYPRIKYRVVEVYEAMASAAAIIAIFYFVLYHFYFKPKRAAEFAEIEHSSPALVQSVNGNGAYTPLRVYHNGKAKKGQFKY